MTNTRCIWTFGLVVVAAASSARAADFPLYVANYGNATVEKYSSAGTPSFFANTAVTNPLGLAFDKTGNLYVAEGTQIEKITPAGSSSIFASGLDAFGLAFDTLGNLYASGSATNKITKITSDGAKSPFAQATGTFGLKGLAFDSAGFLYAADTFDNTIRKYTTGGVESLFATTGPNTLLHDTYGLAFDSLGNLYAANAGGNNISVFAPDGSGAIFASGLNDPLGLAIDGNNNVYVANFNDNTIAKFTPGGVRSPFASTGLNGPSFLAFSAPEPSSGLLVALGMWGAVSWKWRRRVKDAQ